MKRLALLAAAAVVLTACGGPASEPAPADPPVPLGPFGDASFYVSPDSNAAVAYEQLHSSGHHEQAEAVEPLATTPTAVWFGGDSNPFPAVDEVVSQAADAGDVPVLVAYNIPSRDCGLYSAGGSDDVDQYLQWLGSFAEAIGDRETIVVLEPDAVALSVEGCTSGDAAGQHRMLDAAVEVLKRQSGPRVYIDAGNASWIDDTAALATALRASGVGRADGFALNVSNFERTEDSTQYGEAVSELLGGKHFVIDTSRNGAGAPEDTGDHSAWCNPDMVRIGQEPTGTTGHELVDALLWVKLPGDSDGECKPGAPPAGQWWPEYAEMLVGPAPS